MTEPLRDEIMRLARELSKADSIAHAAYVHPAVSVEQKQALNNKALEADAALEAKVNTLCEYNDELVRAHNHRALIISQLEAALAEARAALDIAWKWVPCTNDGTKWTKKEFEAKWEVINNVLGMDGRRTP